MPDFQKSIASPGAHIAGQSAKDSLVTHVSHRAMATDFVVLLPAHQADRVETVMEALESLDEIESRLTVYRPSSEVSKINREAANGPVRVSTNTFRVLERALAWSERTSGAFDISAGPLVEAWGFTERSGRKPTQAEIDQALSRVGFQHIELSAEDRTVCFHRPGMSINLGAIGKGDALDSLKRYLLHAGVEHFLIHGGNSSVIAHGNQFHGSQFEDELTDETNPGWAVGIAHPTKPKDRIAGVWLKNQSLATSGSGKQFFHHRGKRFGHVIDPRSGWPAGDLLSLTVIMNSATDADACATGLFVLGSDQFADHRQNDWWPPMVTVSPAPRQNEVSIDSHGDILWVDEQ
ncbi:FAD:protein FMN transferase [Rubripirellula obstinata]|nr:FAD:protein FMN transferase [Rubripirellula obstinata]